MKKSGPLFLLLLLALQTVGCGSSTPRSLQSVTASPTTADAMNFPNGQVQFTATGIFNRPPTRVTPYPVAWATSQASVATIGNTNGLAQCIPGQTGTVTIEVGVAGDGPLVQVATLMCP
jgi:hypothetical protein